VIPERVWLRELQEGAQMARGLKFNEARFADKATRVLGRTVNFVQACKALSQMYEQGSPPTTGVPVELWEDFNTARRIYNRQQRKAQKG